MAPSPGSPWSCGLGDRRQEIHNYVTANSRKCYESSEQDTVLHNKKGIPRMG